MRVFCVATLDNQPQIDNLVQCIEIIGGKPIVNGTDVLVEFDGEKSKADKLIELFEHYSRHGIYTEETL